MMLKNDDRLRGEGSMGKEGPSKTKEDLVEGGEICRTYQPLMRDTEVQKRSQALSYLMSYPK